MTTLETVSPDTRPGTVTPGQPRYSGVRVIPERSIRFHVSTLLSATLVFISGAGPTLAQDASGGSGTRLDRALFQFNVGQIEINEELDEPWRYEMQYRFTPLTEYRIVPSLSAAWSNNGNNFIAAELRRDFRLTGPWLVTPSFGVGHFNNREDLDLGYPLEFRSGLEISYQFENGYRLGAAIFHLSNGGFSDDNPGTESGVISLTIPIR